VRGTGLQAMTAMPSLRFIPARAGNSAMAPIRSVRRSVHPRACGEQGVAPCWGFVTSGSSPRVRGTVSSSLRSMRSRRFIPARAGNRSSKSSGGVTMTVHPRACGEQRIAPSGNVRGNGSSPRVRGTALSPVI